MIFHSMSCEAFCVPFRPVSFHYLPKQVLNKPSFHWLLNRIHFLSFYHMYCTLHHDDNCVPLVFPTFFFYLSANKIMHVSAIAEDQSSLFSVNCYFNNTCTNAAFWDSVFCIWFRTIVHNIFMKITNECARLFICFLFNANYMIISICLF